MQELISTWLKPAIALPLSKSGDPTESSLMPESPRFSVFARNFRHPTERLILVYQHVTGNQRSSLPFPKARPSENLQEGNGAENQLYHTENRSEMYKKETIHPGKGSHHYTKCCISVSKSRKE